MSDPYPTAWKSATFPHHYSEVLFIGEVLFQWIALETNIMNWRGRWTTAGSTFESPIQISWISFNSNLNRQWKFSDLIQFFLKFIPRTLLTLKKCNLFTCLPSVLPCSDFCSWCPLSSKLFTTWIIIINNEP